MTSAKETPRDFRRRIKRAEDSCDLWKKKHKASKYESKKNRSKLDAVKSGRDEYRERYQKESSLTKDLEERLEIAKETIKNQKNDIENYKEELKKKAKLKV